MKLTKINSSIVLYIYTIIVLVFLAFPVYAERPSVSSDVSVEQYYAGIPLNIFTEDGQIYFHVIIQKQFKVGDDTMLVFEHNGTTILLPYRNIRRMEYAETQKRP